MDRRVNKREEDELTRLEKENRELKAVNRSLMKQLKKLAKGINKEEVEQALERIEDHAPTKEHTQEEAPCPECGRKGLKEIILAGRKFQRCCICSFKSGRIK